MFYLFEPDFFRKVSIDYCEIRFNGIMQSVSDLFVYGFVFSVIYSQCNLENIMESS